LSLDGILATVGEARAQNVDIVGADPVLPSPLRIGEAGAATIAACGLMAARLWELRTGRQQDVRVDVDAAAAGMRSSRYLRVLSGDKAERRDFRPRAAQLGPSVFPARDGRWIYLHRTFPHHRERIDALVGGDQSVAKWDALALENAVYAAGACAAMVRSADEWHVHAQGKGIAELPLLELSRIGDAPPRPFAKEGSRPLSGIRVLDLTRVLAGPTCARTLAEHGADVLRVGTPRVPDDVAMMRDTGHGKRSTALELTSPSDADKLRSLVGEADVFAQGYRPGAIAALGFGPEQLIAQRPGLVYLQLSAFSHRGPWAGRRGFDSIVQAVSGISEEHVRDGTPGFAPANPLDYMTGYLAAFGVMAALHRRAREGGSYLVRLSLAQTGHWLAGLPRIPAALVSNTPVDLPAERLEALMMTSDTPFGRLQHLAPIVQMSETSPRWEHPSVPLAHNAPEWW
jgi:crotonobetainyl-CoA:carnitine CoA-transferase CaiB-like acyl-CoA transferase